MTENDLNILHQKMQRKLDPEINLIDKIYFCPCLEEKNVIVVSQKQECLKMQK